MSCCENTWYGDGGGASGSTYPCSHRRIRAAARSRESSEVARNKAFFRDPGRRPVRPKRCKKLPTEAGASICITWSKFPTSTPNSRTLVATITQSSPCAKAFSALERCSGLSELCVTWVFTSRSRRFAPSFSAFARLSTNASLFFPCEAWIRQQPRFPRNRHSLERPPRFRFRRCQIFVRRIPFGSRS